MPDQRFQQVHIDIIGPFAPSGGVRYCLTMLDRFSRWPEVCPLKNLSAESMANAFYATWVSRYGAPAVVITDQGAHFESILFKSLAKLNGCKQTRTTPYHPASNGAIERWHGSLKASIMCRKGKANWIQLLPMVLIGLRNSIKEDLGASPAESGYLANGSSTVTITSTSVISSSSCGSTCENCVHV